jgi:uncharacterized membrane protein (DUF4010 family)
MGGFYSSTATTVVLARRLKAAGGPAPDLVAGIVAATAIMYLRIDVVVALFDPSLALDLAPPLLALALIGALTAWLLWRRRGAGVPRQKLATGHPLQLTAAAVFAVAFVAVSALANWIKGSLGAAGLIALALVVGFADVDPFVVSMAQQGAAASPTPLLAAAVMAAASSNNVLKGGYALGFGGRRAGLAPALALVVLGAIGFAVAAAYLRFGAALMP